MREFHAEGTIPTPIEEIAEFKCGLDIIPVPGLRDLLEIDGFISSDSGELKRCLERVKKLNFGLLSTM